jgi:hypothetical protein
LDEVPRRGLHFRWRRGPDAPWSPFSVAQVLPDPAAPARAGGTLPWRPMITRPQELSGPDQADLPYLYPRGRYWGEGGQFAHGAARGLSDPDVVIWGQDMGSVRASHDNGHSWILLPNLGNPLIGGNACAVDPADSNVLLALMSSQAPGEFSRALNATEGIYRSADGGQSWSLAQAVPEVPYRQRFFQNNFACWPLSGGTAQNRTWRLISMTQVNQQDPEPGTFWVSRNGGQSWIPGPALPAAMARAPFFALVQHPAEAERLIVCSGAGPWQTADGGITWAPAFGGRFTAECRSVWIDPERPHSVFVAVTDTGDKDEGLWHSDNGGESWQQVLEDFNPSNFAVGPADASGIRTFYVHSPSQREPTARIRDWDGDRFLGRSWITPEVVRPLRHERDWAFDAISGQPQAMFLPHPADPDSCLCHGRAVWWRSEDRGRSWIYSSTGFGGQSCRDAHFDPDDWRRIDLASADFGAVSTPNAGDWVTRSNVTGPRQEAGSQWGRMRTRVGAGRVPYRSATAITRLPRNASVSDPAARGRLIMMLGGASRQFIFTRDEGQEDWKDFIDLPAERGGDGLSRWFAAYSRQNPDVVYAGPAVSADGGSSWTGTAGLTPVIAMSHQNGDVVYGGSRRQVILRSRNRGLQWDETPFFSPGWDLAGGSRYAFWLSPHDDRRAFTLTRTQDLLMLYGDPGTVRTSDLALRRQYSPVPPGFHIAGVAFSGQDPRLIYVLAGVSGAPAVWAGYFSPDFTRIDWQDITGNAPRVAMSNDLAVHPLTGDVFVMGGQGIWVHPPPGGPGEASVWQNCPEPLPVRGLSVRE